MCHTIPVDPWTHCTWSEVAKLDDNCWIFGHFVDLWVPFPIVGAAGGSVGVDRPQRDALARQRVADVGVAVAVAGDADRPQWSHPLRPFINDIQIERGD